MLPQKKNIHLGVYLVPIYIPLTFLNGSTLNIMSKSFSENQFQTTSDVLGHIFLK